MHILRSTSSHRTRPQSRDPNSCARPSHEPLAGNEFPVSTSRCGAWREEKRGLAPAHHRAASQVKDPDKSALSFRSRRSIRELPENKVVPCPRTIREDRFRDDDADVELTITALPYEALESDTGTLVTIEQKLQLIGALSEGCPGSGEITGVSAFEIIKRLRTSRLTGHCYRPRRRSEGSIPVNDKPRLRRRTLLPRSCHLRNRCAKVELRRRTAREHQRAQDRCKHSDRGSSHSAAPHHTGGSFQPSGPIAEPSVIQPRAVSLTIAARSEHSPRTRSHVRRSPQSAKSVPDRRMQAKETAAQP